MPGPADSLLAQAGERFSPEELTRLQQAVEFAADAHRGQVRGTGEPYVEHALAVAEILFGWQLDAATVTAAVLHDVPEDTSRTHEEITFVFGDEIAHLVAGVTKLSGVRIPKGRTAYRVENLRRLFLAMAEDIRVVLLKLADRLHNMRTLDGVPPSKRPRIATETLEVFAPLADRLGMGEVRSELDDLGFKHADPAEYKWTAQQVRQSATRRDRYIAVATHELGELMESEGIEAELNARIKNLYSLHRKLLKKDRDIDRIYDLFAIRVIVETVEQCYRGMGAVHQRFQPLPHRIKDYIAVPKSNGYQSLHTTIFGPEQRMLEVQFRTRAMHEAAELGVAAHAMYADDKRSVVAPAEQLAVMRQLSSWHDELAAGGDVEGMKLDLFAKRVFVFTPHGAIHSLAAGSTPVDFAYSVHTEVGHTCTGAKVNGVLVSLETGLQNGDVVEIQTSPGSEPKRDWLRFVKSGGARSAIRTALRKSGRDDSLKAGQVKLIELAERLDTDPKTLATQQVDRLVAAVPQAESFDDVLAALGDNLVTVERLARVVQPPAPRRKIAGPAIQAGVVVEGTAGVRTKLAKCCDPKPPRAIRGYVTIGHGITIHDRRCRQVAAADPARLVRAAWQ